MAIIHAHAAIIDGQDNDEGSRNVMYQVLRWIIQTLQQHPIMQQPAVAVTVLVTLAVTLSYSRT